jgi:hypothetical protein
MTRPLRRAHRRIWLALAVFLPALFLAGLWVRQEPQPPNGGLQWSSYK